MLNELISIVWFLLPAAFANMAPVIFNRTDFLNKPINSKLFGSHKTYRGFFFGILLSIFVIFIQELFSGFLEGYLLINYSPSFELMFIGVILGFSALLGDLVKSFFKRRRKIKPGQSWIPFDQIDWVLMVLIFSIFIVKLNFWHFFFAIATYSFLNILINKISFTFNIRDTKI